MKAPIPWLRALVEGVVIVGSILLAFGIDASWQERTERQAERDALAGLLRDFQDIEEGLLTWGGLARRKHETIQGFLDGPARVADASRPGGFERDLTPWKKGRTPGDTGPGSRAGSEALERWAPLQHSSSQERGTCVDRYS